MDNDPAAFNSNLHWLVMHTSSSRSHEPQGRPSHAQLWRPTPHRCGCRRFQDTVYVDRLEGVGGGTLWMDQLETPW